MYSPKKMSDSETSVVLLMSAFQQPAWRLSSRDTDMCWQLYGASSFLKSFLSLLWQSQILTHVKRMANTTAQQPPRSSGAQPLCRSPVGFSRSYLCLPSWASTLRTCSKNVTFDCHPLFFVFRGAVPGALQGDRSWRRASRLTARVSSGTAKCLADDSAVWKELPRWRDQVRYETFFLSFHIIPILGSLFFHCSLQCEAGLCS